MRVAVVTDIHSNLPALEAVLDACAPYDALWVLGDVVGYGPYPDEVVARLRKERAVAIRGNHDAAVLGELDTSVFNDDARLAVEWTAERIGTTARHWLDGLPETRKEEAFTGRTAPLDCCGKVLVLVSLARRKPDHFETPYSIVVHTHVPLVYRMTARASRSSTPGRHALDLDDALHPQPGRRGAAARRRPEGLRHDARHGDPVRGVAAGAVPCGTGPGADAPAGSPHSSL